MTNYTIIIPHKNIPDLLQRCLDSIPERDDIQIIIVDDNSIPTKVDFNAFPGLNRKNTEVYFTKEDKGAGYARNTGMKHAKGKWLIFADADDFFMPCFNEILELYKDNVHDIVYFKTTSVDSDTFQYHNRSEYLNYILSKIQRTKNWNLAIILTPPWGKFIKRSLIEHNNIRFQETQYSNDVFFSMRVAISDSIKIISNDILYCVTYRTGSLTRVDHLSKKQKLKPLTIRYQVSCEADSYLKKIGKKQYFCSRSIAWWIQLCRIDLKQFILLFEIIKQYGLYRVVTGILRLILSKLRKIIKKKCQNFAIKNHKRRNH
ncbi:MAG: glycosyltransferase [Prevotellaceae bacterium]|jgi:glycosyltransferase involved in cell wall biosynthesis|nr:glycosyltransferase [Prevotellaceae bacterium]